VVMVFMFIPSLKLLFYPVDSSIFTFCFSPLAAITVPEIPHWGGESKGNDPPAAPSLQVHSVDWQIVFLQ
jgi:hypothetical protein